MPDNVVQQVRDRLDIAEVVSSYIKLEKTGINLRAPCPFHSEKKPSFFVSPARQSFKCFGCGKAGSIFDFVMEIEGVEFGDALRILAKRAGVQMQSFNPQLKTKRQRLYEIAEIACKFFEKQLQASQRGKTVKQYLLKRGLTDASIKQWRLGYAPEQWRALSDFLVSRGYQRQEIVEAGLAVKSDKSPTPYDRFRGRIIFPIFDLHSQVIGFGGRVLEGNEDTAKYLNTPNSLLYDKSKVLYGLNFAKVEMRKKDACILTEGYTDVIMSHQAGFINTVASSGTALTSFQLQILKRYTLNLLTAFDMDTAGGLATKRGIDLAQQADFEVKVISMPKDKDPADVIFESSAKWQKLIDKAQDIMTFYFEDALGKHDKNNPQGKKEIAKLLLPAIKKIPNHILQSHWAQKLSGALKVSEKAILDELKKVARVAQKRRGTRSDVAASQPPRAITAKPRRALLEERILTLILGNPKHLACISADNLNYFSDNFKEILTFCKKLKFSDTENFRQELDKLEKKREPIRTILQNCSFSPTLDSIDSPEQEIKICLASLRTLSCQDRLEALSLEIKRAEQDKDSEKLKQLMKQFNQLAKLQ